MNINYTMDIGLVVWILTIVLTFVAAWVDWRSRRIPNWLTIPGLVAGITLHAGIAGWRGALFALEGAALALVVLLPLVLLRAFGAGDWKLMGAVGAFLGPIFFLCVFLGSIFASGLMAMIQMMQAGRVAETFRNLWVLVKGFFSFGLRPNPRISLDNPKLMKLPFGVAVAVATLLCAVHWGF